MASDEKRPNRDWRRATAGRRRAGRDAPFAVAEFGEARPRWTALAHDSSFGDRCNWISTWCCVDLLNPA